MSSPLQVISGFWRRIWVRFALLYTVIFAASLILVLVLTLVIGRNYLLELVRGQIQAEIQFLHYEYREDGLPELLEETEERIEKSVADRRLKYVVQNHDGETLFDDFPAEPGQLGWQSRETTRDGKTARYLFYYQALDGDYVLGVGSPLNALEDFQAAVGKAFVITLVIAAGIGIVSGFGVGVWISRRLRILVRALQRVAAGNWQTRVPENVGGYEFERLAHELNRMFQQLEQSIANLKYISAGISHDLRTPITRLRNRMVALQSRPPETAPLQDELEQAQRELDGLLSYFDSALLINELQSGDLARNFEVLDFSDLLEKMLDHYGPLLEDAGLVLNVDLQKPLQVRGMASLLQRLIANLLDNVLLHGSGGAPLAVSLVKQGKNACLTLVNSLKPDEESSSGTYNLPAGLERKRMGQKIIQAITAAHGGRCEITRDGLHHTCRIILPLV